MTDPQGNIKSRHGRSLADRGNHFFNLWLFIRVKLSTLKPNIVVRILVSSMLVLVFAWLRWHFSRYEEILQCLQRCFPIS